MNFMGEKIAKGCMKAVFINLLPTIFFNPAFYFLY